MDENQCNYCGKSFEETPTEYSVTLPDGVKEQFCSAKCARDKYREELQKNGD